MSFIDLVKRYTIQLIKFYICTISVSCSCCTIITSCWCSNCSTRNCTYNDFITNLNVNIWTIITCNKFRVCINWNTCLCCWRNSRCKCCSNIRNHSTNNHIVICRIHMMIWMCHLNKRLTTNSSHWVNWKCLTWNNIIVKCQFTARTSNKTCSMDCELHIFILIWIPSSIILWFKQNTQVWLFWNHSCTTNIKFTHSRNPCKITFTRCEQNNTVFNFIFNINRSIKSKCCGNICCWW